jgi:nucleoside 2-deoxyribosyltransferase
MARRPRVYLAGPEVFLANARAIGQRKRAICARHGLRGIFPGDAEPPRDPTRTPQHCALAISQAMEAAMRSCDAMIVNLTPFRGVSADVGSVYEMGFMRGLGRPVFGYTHDPICYRDRVARACADTLRQRITGEPEDADGMVVENFGLHDNLMLAGGLAASGGHPVSHVVPYPERFTALTAFAQCVAHAATALAAS